MDKKRVFTIIVVVNIVVVTALVVAIISWRPEKRESVGEDANQYLVQYVPKEAIYPAFGYNGGGRAIIREDLPPRIKNFVQAHELYHLQDQATWGGWIGREVRANIVPGLKDPIGLLATAWGSITDMDRLGFYLQRFQMGR